MLLLKQWENYIEIRQKLTDHIQAQIVIFFLRYDKILACEQFVNASQIEQVKLAVRGKS